jgi:hypothetical protein
VKVIAAAPSLKSFVPANTLKQKSK